MNLRDSTGEEVTGITTVAGCEMEITNTCGAGPEMVMLPTRL